MRLEYDRAPGTEVEVARRPPNLVGDPAQLRTDVLTHVGTLGVEIEAAENEPLAVEQQCRLPGIDQNIRKQSLSLAWR